MQQELIEPKVSQFEIGDLVTIGLVLVVTGVALAYGLSAMSEMKGDFQEQHVAASCGLNSSGGTGGTILYDACGADYNASVDAITGVAKLPEKMPLIATVVVAAIIIGILVRYLLIRM